VRYQGNEGSHYFSNTVRVVSYLFVFIVNKYQTVKRSEYRRLNDEMIGLAGIYVREGSLTEKSIDEAQPIASISEVSATISWNFKPMVNFIRFRQYDGIRLGRVMVQLGYIHR
jgi:hypothetical protein